MFNGITNYNFWSFFQGLFSTRSSRENAFNSFEIMGQAVHHRQTTGGHAARARLPHPARVLPSAGKEADSALYSRSPQFERAGGL